MKSPRPSGGRENGRQHCRRLRQIEMFCAVLPASPVLRDKQFTIIADPPTVISAKRPTVSLTVEALMRLVNGVWAAKILATADYSEVTVLSPWRRRRKKRLMRGLVLLCGVMWIWLIKDCCYLCCLTKNRRRKNGRSWPALLMSVISRRDITKKSWIATLACFALRRDIPLAGITQKNGRVRLNDYPLSGELTSHPPKADSAISVRVVEMDLVAQRLRFQAL